jgi:PAS domain S-box-containing protein
VNDAYVAFTGRPREALLGLDPVDLMPEEDRAAHIASRVVDLSERMPTGLVERRLLDGEGRERWYRAARSTLDDEQGRRLYASVLQDATAEHHAREQVDRSLRELEQWFEISPIGMLMFDRHGLIVRSNPALEALLGSVPVTLPDGDAALCALLGWGPGGPHPSLQPSAPALERVVSIVAADGRARQLRARVRAIEPSPHHRRYLAVIEDRSAEDERDLAQIEIGALMDTASVGVATFEPSRGWLPSAVPRAAGGDRRDGRGMAALQSISRELVDPASRDDYERLQRALKRGERAEVRYAVRHPELGLRWLLTRVEPGQLASGRTTTSVVTLDVTEQEQAQRRNEQLLRELATILDGTSAGIAYLRGTLLVRCNLRFERMLGLAGGRAAGLTLGELFKGQPSVQSMIQDIGSALRSSNMFETEFQLVHPQAKPGTWYSLSVRRAAGGTQGEAGEVVAVLTDISRLKSQQVELENLLHERELMFNLSEVGIAWLRGNRIERANEAFAVLTGHTPAELATLEHADLFEDRAAWLYYRAHDEPVLAEHGRVASERRLRRRDGSLIWVQVNQRRVDEADAEAGLICSFVNVDERQRARQSLVRQADRTRSILDSVLVGIVTVSEGGIEWMNRSARRMFSGELADFVGEPISTVATPEPDHPLRQTHYLHVLADGEAEAFECRLKARDGREFWVVGNVVATRAEASAGRQLTFALLDIERRRQAEERIVQAQASLQRIIETAPLAIGLHDAKTLQLLQLNQMAATFIGRPLESSVGEPLEALFPAEVAAVLKADMAEALLTEEVTHREYRREAPDGSPRVWDARYVPLAATPGAAPEQLLLVASDVTGQRAAEAARFEAAIAQREMLVREVHHRIKNNLQGVAGLMQQIAQRRPEVAPVISEAIGQVQAIAQVYGLQVGASGPLRIRSLLEAITGSVQRMFGRSIVLGVEGEAPHRWALPEAESIPIALTLNELLTNALKHSPGPTAADAAPVHCTLYCGDAQVRIEIANRGRLPAGFDLARVPGGVSGLGLVRALLPRRNAALTLAERPDDRGTEVVAVVVLLPPGVHVLEPL